MSDDSPTEIAEELREVTEGIYYEDDETIQIGPERSEDLRLEAARFSDTEDIPISTTSPPFGLVEELNISLNDSEDIASGTDTVDDDTADVEVEKKPSADEISDLPDCPISGCDYKIKGDLHDHMIEVHGWYSESLEDELGTGDQ